MHRSTRVRGPLWIALMTLALAASLPALGSAGETIIASGDLKLGAPDTCSSPIDICSRSRLTGHVKKYVFTATDVVTTDDPNVVVIIGNSRIRLRDGGVLFSNDTVRINNATLDALHLWAFTGGKRGYKGASGSMSAAGSLAGVDFSYVAQIATPED